MGLFKQYLITTYGSPPTPGSWLTLTPKKIEDELFEFLVGNHNKGYLAMQEKFEIQFKSFNSNIITSTTKTDQKLSRIPINLTLIQKTQQRRVHLEPHVDLLDDYAGKFIALGNQAIILMNEEAEAKRLKEIFDGEWATNDNASGGDVVNGDCNKYNMKHFGGDNNAARYVLPNTVNISIYKWVLGLETKAIRVGLDVPGAYIFKFKENVGKDGTSGVNSPMTKCIRVDSVGSGGQHSHPIPESGQLKTAHDNLVKTEIIKATNAEDLERLIELAQYLKVIGASKNEYQLSLNDRRELTKALRSCFFWKAD